MKEVLVLNDDGLNLLGTRVASQTHRAMAGSR